jgi:hypothetical protein
VFTVDIAGMSSMQATLTAPLNGPAISGTINGTSTMTATLISRPVIVATIGGSSSMQATLTTPQVEAEEPEGPGYSSATVVWKYRHNQVEIVGNSAGRSSADPVKD